MALDKTSSASTCGIIVLAPVQVSKIELSYENAPNQGSVCGPGWRTAKGRWRGYLGANVRLGQGGQVRMDWFTNESQAVAALITLEASRRKRGYWVEPQQLAMLG